MKTEEQAVRSQQKLAPLVWEFNFRPDHYIHTTWLESLPEGELIKKLVGRHRAAERVVQHLMERLGLENQMFFDFSSSLTRMALWSGEDLEKLVLYVGTVFNYQRVQRIVERDEVAVVREAIGEELFLFMHRRAPIVISRPPSGVNLPEKVDIRTSLIIAGLLCLHEALSEHPSALRKRLMLKLPREWFALYKQMAYLGKKTLSEQHAECVALIQKVAVEIRMGVNSDGKIRFS